METFDGDNVIAKFKEDCKFCCCISLSIYIYTICQPLIDWVLGVLKNLRADFVFFYLL